MMEEQQQPTIEEAHNALANFVFSLSQQFENLSNLFHIALHQLGLAEDAECSNCGTRVVYPNLPEFVAFPLCPNAQHDEACKTGFSHIPNPFDRSDEDDPAQVHSAETEE